MNDLAEILKKENIEKTCIEMHLDFGKIFPDSQDFDANPYRNHIWVVKQNADFLVINAIPREKDQDCLFWEEWYMHKGEVHHHILSLYRPLGYQEVFQAPESDDIHPSFCFGSRWYVIEDPDMSAVLLRR